MHKRKSKRHQRAANVRWRNAEARANAERAEGIGDRPAPGDCRQPFALPLAHLGWRDVLIEPVAGRIAWRARDAETGEAVHAASLKEMLRWVAGQVPRMLASRHFL